MSDVMLMMAGGTGGHVFPALSVADVLRQRGVEVIWLGAEQGIETRLVPAAGYSLNALPVRGFRGAGLKRRLLSPLLLLRSVFSAWRIMRKVRPVLAVGFGGYASGPGAIAARLAGVPLVIHEQNARPGLTNRILAPVARQVLQGFPGAFSGNAMTTGNPVRDVIVSLPEPAQRYGARQGPLRILITGGSQGALALNRDLPAALVEAFSSVEVEVIHQAGRGRIEEAAEQWRNFSMPVEVVEFIDDMAAAFAQADLVICRSGASTVSEIAAAGVAALFIPLPTAVDDHQTWNARWLVDQDAARLLPQSELNADNLRRVLRGLDQRDALAQLASRARACAFIHSAEKVADICQEVARG